MTPDMKPGSELSSSNFEEKFQLLSNPVETVRPIDSITDKDIAEIKFALENSGCNFDINEEAKNYLREHQIRNINQGRGIGVVAVVGSVRTQNLFDKCEEIAIKHNWKQKFPSGGLGVGLKHTVADMISLVVLPEDRERIVNNINVRVLRGLRKKYESGTGERNYVELAFSEFSKTEAKKTQSTNPPESLKELWDAMLSK